MPAHVRLNNVFLRYPVYGASQKSFRSSLFSRLNASISRENGSLSVSALEDVSLSFEEGSRVGLIGMNGAGKSTLLRIMGGIYAPSAGNVEIAGKVSCLFNYNLGMDVDDTGYENIRLIGMYLGMSPEEIEARTQDIAEFTELGEFLSVPVRAYSSGMVTRLSFSIATSIHPDVLLLDEGFGTGDARFAGRAFDRIMRLVDRTQVLVLASHDNQLIRSMCNKAVLLDRGRVCAVGDVDSVISAYQELCAAR